MSKRTTGSAVDPKNTATSKAKFIEEFRKKDEEIEKLKKALEGAKKGHEKQLNDNKALKTELAKVKKAEADAKKAEADSKKAETQAQADLKKVQLENAGLKNKLDAANKRAEDAEKKATAGASELDIANGKVGTHTEYGFAVDVPGVGKKVVNIDNDKVKTIIDSYGPDAGKNSWWWVNKSGVVDETEGNNGVPTLGQLVNLGKI